MHTITDPPPPECVYTAIATVRQRWLTSFAQYDPLDFVYAADAQLLPPYSPAISGRAAIQAFWRGCNDMGIGTAQRTPTEVDCLLDTINEVGEYRLLDRHGRVVDVGNYIVIWKHQQGQWQIHRDIWTSNLPPNSSSSSFSFSKL